MAINYVASNLLYYVTAVTSYHVLDASFLYMCPLFDCAVAIRNSGRLPIPSSRHSYAMAGSKIGPDSGKITMEAALFYKFHLVGHVQGVFLLLGGDELDVNIVE